MRQIQTFIGRGKLINGTESFPVSYTVRVFQDAREGVHSFKSIEGMLAFDDEGAVFRLAVQGRKMTLVMENKMKLDGFLTDSRGTFKGTGPIHE